MLKSRTYFPHSPSFRRIVENVKSLFPELPLHEDLVVLGDLFIEHTHLGVLLPREGGGLSDLAEQAAVAQEVDQIQTFWGKTRRNGRNTLGHDLLISCFFLTVQYVVRLVHESVELGLVFCGDVARRVVVSVVLAGVVEDGVDEDEEDEASDQVDNFGWCDSHLAIRVGDEGDQNITWN